MSGESPLDRVLALAVIPELADLDPDSVASIAKLADERRWLPDGLPDPQSSEPEECVVSFLLSGSVEVGASGRRIAAPALIGAVETLAGVPLAIRATGGVAQGLTIGRDALLWLLSDVFEVWLAMMHHTAARWLTAEDVASEPRVDDPAAWERPDSQPGVSIARRILLLGACEIFREWRVHSLGRLALAMEELELPAHSALWEAGSPASDCFAVVEGGLESVSPGGGSLRHEPGEVVGLREALAARDRTSRLATTAKARVLRLVGEALIDELEDDPEMAAVLLDALAQRVLRAERERGAKERG